MGSTFLKAIYREYTDDTFTKRKAQEHASDAMAGPTLRAEVGDMITVVFKVHPLTWKHATLAQYIQAEYNRVLNPRVREWILSS